MRLLVNTFSKIFILFKSSIDLVIEVWLNSDLLREKALTSNISA